MSLDEMIENDLSSCNEFGGSLKHFYQDQDEVLDYLCFDEATEVILDNGSFEGVAAIVPTVLIQTSISSKINNSSYLEVKETLYSVTEVQKMKDRSSLIILEIQND